MILTIKFIASLATLITAVLGVWIVVYVVVGFIKMGKDMSWGGYGDEI